MAPTRPADIISMSMTTVRGKRVTVAGLGRFGGGIEVARWLVGQGATVLVTDQKPAEQLADSLRQLEGLPITFRLGEHQSGDFTSADLVVASPAIPRTSEHLSAARAAGVPVTTEIRLFIERCPVKILGVTGSKGKSTTTAMLGAMLRQRFAVHVGGNIGGSLLNRLEQIEPSDLVVLELSSYMLDYLADVKWSPHVALVTMLTRDHVDWHGSVEAYHEAKKTIVRFQRPDDYAVLPESDAEAMKWRAETSATVIPFGLDGRKPFELILPGRHNQLNAQGAFAAAQVMGVTFAEAQAALRDFKGLPHRLQLVHESPTGVRYFNDSIATIPEAAVAALESFPRHRVIQIVGGYDKHLPMGALTAALQDRARGVLCIGALGPSIARALEGAATTAGMEVYNCGDLATAMRLARQIAGPGEIVLLSPGCASYDQFANFEQRGLEFAHLAAMND